MDVCVWGCGMQGGESSCPSACVCMRMHARRYTHASICVCRSTHLSFPGEVFGTPACLRQYACIGLYVDYGLSMVPCRYVGFGADGHWESLLGTCPTFKESLEGYMQTAGTHYRMLVDMFYDGLVHPISASGFQADLTNFNRSDTFPEGYNLTCNCKAYTEDPCQGELSLVCLAGSMDACL